ncbi:hypothetical protein KVR01_000438 [Diaporthe batatas]|uniref:uncharacterized protein n=1 Tax=Diaporthe batatas TaxID=748121 RepID=UPI001D04D9D1|nr:uncharacterized protein KVR01_000438 [Diaporthe batatas]KAG8169693.1 hypothetical protein KVR01_000438 [Diaporthe batatas]
MRLFLAISHVALAMASFPSPILPPSLPYLFAPDANPSLPDLMAESQIRNTLATYAFAIDSKNFTALSSVFHSDAVANYSEPINVISGLIEIVNTLENSLGLFAGTQHNYGTQAIRIDDAGSCARVVTYYTAAHFGKGEAEGQVYQSSQILPCSCLLVVFWSHEGCISLMLTPFCPRCSMHMGSTRIYSHSLGKEDG